MASKNGTRTFRPWNENWRRLEVAESIGLNVSELLNEIIEKNFDDLLKEKSKRIQAALKHVPA